MRPREAPPDQNSFFLPFFGWFPLDADEANLQKTIFPELVRYTTSFTYFRASQKPTPFHQRIPLPLTNEEVWADLDQPIDRAVYDYLTQLQSSFTEKQQRQQQQERGETKHEEPTSGVALFEYLKENLIN